MLARIDDIEDPNHYRLGSIRLQLSFSVDRLFSCSIKESKSNDILCILRNFECTQ